MKRNLTLRFSIFCFFLVGLLGPFYEAYALTGAQVSVSRSSEPYFILDSNNPCADGPRAAYVGIQIRNISGAQLNKVTIKIANVTPTAKYKYLGSGLDSNRWIGRLNANDTGTAFFYIKYQCALDNDTCYLTFNINDSASGTVTFSTKVYTRNSISASAGGQLITHSFSTARNLGVLVTDTVVYNYGNIGNGTEINLQPNGDTLFNPSSLILINSQILSSQINSVNAGTRNKTYFVATANTNGSSNQIRVVYYYLNKLRPGDSVIVHPYAGMTSGNTNYKYTGNYLDPAFSKYLVSTAGNLAITKSISSYYGNTGDTVKYTINIKNNGNASIVFDEVVDTLHTGYSYISLDPSSTINSSNSTLVPSSGATGELIFRGGLASASFPYLTYTLNAGDSLRIIFNAKLPSQSYGVDTNTAFVKIGTSSVSNDTALNEILLCASGQLYDDRNGLVDGVINGKLLDSSFKITTYAYLVSNASRKIVETATVDVSGGFKFKSAQKDTSYILVLSTQSLSKGANNPASAVLPTDWVATGENFGVNNASGSGNESGTPNSIIAVSFGSLDISSLRFGWEKLPASFSNSNASQLNPGSNIKVVSASLAGFDLEDDSITSGKKFVIYTLSNNAGFYYNDTLLKANDTIRNYNRLKLTVDPQFSGQGTATFTYSAIDSANRVSTSPATITIPFSGLSISGTLFNDANGLVNSTVDGTPTDAPGGTTLYSYLTSTGGNIIAKDTLNNGNGTYMFSQAADANSSYQLAISSSNLNIGAAGPSQAGLPSGYVAVGESFGVNNNAGTGNESGTPDLKISVTSTTSSITSVNFGIEQKNTAHSKSYSGLNSGYFAQSSSNSSYPFKVSLNSASGTTDGNVSSVSSSVLPGKLSGLDPEDGKYGGQTGSSGVRTLILNVLPDSANNVLVYNGTVLNPGNTSNTYWNATASRYEISNFNPDLLDLYLRQNGHKSFSFTYSWRDAAGIEGNTAGYSAQSLQSLPVILESFDAQWNGDHTTLNWRTASEKNADYFIIERSTNLIDFEPIIRKTAIGNSLYSSEYSAIDYGISAQTSETVYYRLKMVDLDGAVEFSDIKTVQRHPGKTITTYNIWPVPFQSELQISFHSESKEQIAFRLCDVQGRMIKEVNATPSVGANQFNLNFGDLKAGTYILTLTQGQQTSNYKLFKL